MRDPVLTAMAAWTLLAVVLFAALQGDSTRQIQAYWALQLPLDAVLAVCSWRVFRLAEGAIRRFWCVLGVVGTLFTIGDGYQAVLVVLRPAGASTIGSPVQAGCLAVGQAAVVISMLIHPHATRTGRARLALWLDSATVLVGGAVVSWSFTDASPRSSDAMAAVATAGVPMVAAFAAVKMVLAGNAPMNKRAAAPMIASAAFMGVGTFLAPAGQSANLPASAYVVLFLPSLLIACGPRIQELLALQDESPFGERRHKPYSLIPYGAVAFAFVALVAIIPQGVSVRLWGVVTGVFVVIALVAARQLVAFHDNTQLIGRLDAALGDLREQEGQLRDQALFDGLTKLANRSNFGGQVLEALGNGQSPAGVSLLLIDLDDFKVVNDTMGHAAGDELLVAVGNRLRAAVRAADTVGRLGGDEFAVLLQDTSDDEAEQTAQRILEHLTRPIRILQNDIVIRASVGVAAAGSGTSPESLLRDADIAMYAAKDHGKGHWMRYTPDMGERLLHGAILTRRLSEALARDEFRVDYQPIFRMDDGGIVGTEALLRWRPDPGGPPIPPADFIPITEESGLIVPIGHWVLREACRQAGAWQRAYPAAARQTMSVNVAGRQLREAGFVADVAEALADAGLAPERLSIEVTETAVFDDDTAIATMHELRALGVRLALDDFGTAASSLGLLLTCPVTTLKLDRSFVDDAGDPDRQIAVATAVSQIAGALRLDSVAEGIETPRQAKAMRDLGYTYAQGYLYSEPLPPQEVAAIWEHAACPTPSRLAARLL